MSDRSSIVPSNSTLHQLQQVCSRLAKIHTSSKFQEVYCQISVMHRNDFVYNTLIQTGFKSLDDPYDIDLM